MTIRAKQQLRQRAAIKRLAHHPLSNWYTILNRGYVAWVVMKAVAHDIAAAREFVILNGTRTPVPDSVFTASERIARSLGITA